MKTKNKIFELDGRCFTAKLARQQHGVSAMVELDNGYVLKVKNSLLDYAPFDEKGIIQKLKQKITGKSAN